MNTNEKRTDGGPAFARPFSEVDNGNGRFFLDGQDGMSLRDYFAAKALAALIAKLPLIDREGEHGIKLSAEDKAQWMHDVALSAYDYANHMLKAREQ